MGAAINVGEVYAFESVDTVPSEAADFSSGCFRYGCRVASDDRAMSATGSDEPNFHI